MSSDNTLTSRQKTLLLLKLLGLTGLWAILWLPLHEASPEQLKGKLDPSTSFLIEIVFTFLIISLFQVIFLTILVKAEKPANVRQFFKVEKLDARGVWMTFGIGILVQIANVAFLWNLVLKPAKEFLTSLGLAAPGIGFGTGDQVPTLEPLHAVILTIFLLLVWWVEVPEEMFFRGYIQNNLQTATGKNIAMFLSVLLWDLAHLWSLVNILERFIYGLVYAFVFRVRQNATGPMLVHPIGNRVLLLTAIIPQMWGVRFDSNSAVTWLFALVIYILMIFGAIGLWRMLKIDQRAF